jgi:hypothetical protein
MKKLILFFMISHPFFIIGQNFIENSSFEEITQCPNFFSVYPNDMVRLATGWSSAGGTPDLFNVCSTEPLISVPNAEYFGYSAPKSGNGFAGLFSAYFISILNYWENIPEFIQNNFVSNTINNKLIYFSMNIRHANLLCLVSNNISAILSNGTYDQASSYPTTNRSMFRTCDVVPASEEWMLVSGSFISDGQYGNLIIGNPYDFENTVTERLCDNSISPEHINSAYYFIDDVCLSHNPASCPARQLDLLPPTATCVDGQVVLDAGPGSVHYA